MAPRADTPAWVVFFGVVPAPGQRRGGGCRTTIPVADLRDLDKDGRLNTDEAPGPMLDLLDRAKISDEGFINTDEAGTAQNFRERSEQRSNDGSRYVPRAYMQLERRRAVASAVSEQDRRDIEHSLTGVEEAFARLVARYQAPIARQMWRYSREVGVVEELVQEVFVEAYVSLGKFQGRAPFLHWLRKIAARVGYRHWRQKAREQRRREALAGHVQGPPPSPQAASPSEAGEYVQGLLAHLPPEDRLVLTLHYFEQCDTNEIAQLMGWGRSRVKVRMYRARQKLKVLLEEAGYGGRTET